MNKYTLGIFEYACTIFQKKKVEVPAESIEIKASKIIFLTEQLVDAILTMNKWRVDQIWKMSDVRPRNYFLALEVNFGTDELPEIKKVNHDICLMHFVLLLDFKNAAYINFMWAHNKEYICEAIEILYKNDSEHQIEILNKIFAIPNKHLAEFKKQYVNSINDLKILQSYSNKCSRNEYANYLVNERIKTLTQNEQAIELQKRHDLILEENRQLANAGFITFPVFAEIDIESLPSDEMPSCELTNSSLEKKWSLKSSTLPVNRFVDMVLDALNDPASALDTNTNMEKELAEQKTEAAEMRPIQPTLIPIRGHAGIHAKLQHKQPSLYW